MWREHFRNLCSRAFQDALVIGGATPAGIVLIGIIGILLGFVLTVLIEWGRSSWDRAVLKSSIQTWPPYVAAIFGMLLAWFLLFAYSITKIVYGDHQQLVSERDHAVRDLNRLKVATLKTSAHSFKPKRGVAGTAGSKQASTTQLARDAAELAEDIRTLSRFWRERTGVINAGAETEAIKQSQRDDVNQQVMAKYNRDYKVKANELHSQLLKALGPGDEDLNLTLFYERGFNPDSLEMNASDLDRLAKKLAPIL